MIETDHIIHSEGDGTLTDQSAENISRLVAKAARADHVVIHLHGGLVDEAAGFEMARRLTPFYKDAGAYPVFFVWETGGFETVRNNIGQIFRENVFRALFRLLVKWAWGKSNEKPGAKAVARPPFPTDLDVRSAEKHIFDNVGKDNWTVGALNATPDLSSDQENAFKEEVRNDPAVKAALAAIAETPDAPKKGVTPKGVLALDQASDKTLMSPDIVAELRAEQVEKGVGRPRGFVSTALIAKHALTILKRTINRFRTKRDHGPYTTIVEEILHALYAANIGQVVWKSMKDDAAETFLSVDDGLQRAGRRFFDELATHFAHERNPRVSIVCHSAGSIYAGRMLKHVRDRLGQEGGMPNAFQFENVVFLAPAIRFDEFDATVVASKDLVGRFRMFSLQDELEAGYWEFPGYRGSLLYMVSGLFESGDALHDTPLLGMQRYIDNASVYNEPLHARVRSFLLGDQHRMVWSQNLSAGEGLIADSRKHGHFDQTNIDEGAFRTMNSVRFMIGGPDSV